MQISPRNHLKRLFEIPTGWDASALSLRTMYGSDWRTFSRGTSAGGSSAGGTSTGGLPRDLALAVLLLVEVSAGVAPVLVARPPRHAPDVCCRPLSRCLRSSRILVVKSIAGYGRVRWKE